MFDFTDQVVIITGANGALGTGVTRAFAEAGASLALVSRKEASLREAFPDLTDALLVAADVTDEAEVERMTSKVKSRYGRADVLVNIAGTWRGGKGIPDEDIATFDFLMSVNARSVFLTSKHVSRLMKTQGSGKIVNVASKSALEGSARAAAYAASKSAVLRLTEGLSQDLRGAGVNVNAVLPSTIDTEANRASMPKAKHDHWVTPDSLAGVILFLASELARDIHGAAIPVYGLA